MVVAALRKQYLSRTQHEEAFFFVFSCCCSNPSYKGCSRRLKPLQGASRLAASPAWIRTDLVEFYPVQGASNLSKAPSSTCSRHLKPIQGALKLASQPAQVLHPRRLQAPWRRLGHCSSEVNLCTLVPARYINPKYTLQHKVST